MNNELIFNKQTGQWEEGTVAVKPRRSMTRGGTSNGYDFKFVDSDEVTVLGRYFPDLEDTKVERDELLAASQEITTKDEALREAFKKKSITSQVFNESNEQLKKEVRDINKRQFAMAARIVKASVLGWENGTIPYSDEARDDLPDFIAVEWMGRIIEASELTEKEGGFLAPKSGDGPQVTS
jgi:hypothetical protein